MVWSISNVVSLQADVLWGSLVTDSFLPRGRGENECVANEPTGRLPEAIIWWDGTVRSPQLLASRCIV